jgi:LDH2 family malate/lactate/ureidoglycolate dehydrogenase
VSAPIVVEAAELRERVADALIRSGAVRSDASIQARHLVEGDLRDHPSHGVRRLPVLIERLRAGLLVSGVAPVCTWHGDALLDIDGRRGFGPVVGFGAVDAITERAARTGVALATISNAGHLGMAAPYVERLVERGCLGLVLTVSEALVHPWGGSRPLVGTNPLAIGVPTGRDPLILDMSTAAVSAGRILDHAARHESIPEGWAVDGGGRPTTDPAAAVAGAVSPFGGAKGFALGVALEAFVGVATRTSFGTDVHGTLDIDRPVTKGDVLLALSVELVGGAAAIPALTAYLDAVRASGVGGRAVAVPGDRARRARTERERTGVPVDPIVWRAVQQYARGER